MASNRVALWHITFSEIDILGTSKVDSDWLIGRTSSRIGIVPITYLKDTNTTQILFCGEDFYENITELKQKEQIWILQEKNSQLQAQVGSAQVSTDSLESVYRLETLDQSGPRIFSKNSVSLTFGWSRTTDGPDVHLTLIIYF